MSIPFFLPKLKPIDLYRRIKAMKKWLYIMTLGVFLCPASANAKADSNISFDIYSGNSKIGTHHVTFSKDKSGHTKVEIDINIEVKFAFIPVYDYSHTNTEIWNGNQLLSVQSQTYDNGDEYFVNAAYKKGKLLIKTKAGEEIYPENILSTSYWNKKSMTKGKLINTQTGEIALIDVQKKKNELGECYVLTKDIEAMICYNPKYSNWEGLSFEAKGTQIYYKPITN